MSKVQLITTLDKLITSAVNRFADRFFSQLPAPVCLGPVLASNNPLTSLKDLLDGIFWATPKHRTPLSRIWRRKYGADWNSGGVRLYQPKNNITVCIECGTFHEYHTICRNCFKKVQEESKEIIQSTRDAWGRGVIDKEVQVLYRGETATSPSKRIVELDRPRPIWFATNLSQKTARTITDIKGPMTESIDKTIKVKE